MKESYVAPRVRRPSKTSRAPSQKPARWPAEHNSKWATTFPSDDQSQLRAMYSRLALSKAFILLALHISANYASPEKFLDPGGYSETWLEFFRSAHGFAFRILPPILTTGKGGKRRGQLGLIASMKNSAPAVNTRVFAEYMMPGPTACGRHSNR